MFKARHLVTIHLGSPPRNWKQNKKMLFKTVTRKTHRRALKKVSKNKICSGSHDELIFNQFTDPRDVQSHVYVYFMSWFGGE